MSADRAFDTVCAIETPLATAKDLINALAFIAETMSNDVGSVVQRLAWLAGDQIDAAEDARARLLHMTRPSAGKGASQGGAA